MTYEAAAVELCNEWVFAWLQIFGHENADLDCVGADMLVRRTIHMEPVESSLGSGVVKGCHGGLRRKL